MFRFKKFFSLIIILSLLITVNNTTFAQSNYNTNIEKYGVVYEETFVDNEGKNIKIELKNYIDKTIASTYVNGVLISSSIRKKLNNGKFSDKIHNTRHSDNSKFVYSASSIARQTSDFNNIESYSTNPQPSYQYLEQQNIPEHMSVALLYGENSQTQREKLIYLKAWSPIDLVLSSIPGWIIGSGWGVVAIVAALGSTVLGGIIVDAINGTLTQDVNEWDYELFIRDSDPHCPKELAAKGFIHNITTKVWAPNGEVTTFHDVETSGPYNTKQEFINWGIFVFYL